MRPGPRLTFLTLAAAAALISCHIPKYVPTGAVYAYGISNYAPHATFDTKNTLDIPYPSNDANEVSELFRKNNYTVYTTVDTKDTNSPEVTKSKILEDLNNAAKNLTDKDFFVFFYAGHGGQGSYTFDTGEEKLSPTNRAYLNNEFLVMSDYKTKPFSDTIITDDELAALIEKIPAKRKFIILDCCYSGGFIGDQTAFYDKNKIINGMGKPGIQYNSPEAAAWFYLNGMENGEKDLSLENTYVLTAASTLQISKDYHPGSNGYFTESFLEAALNGDKNRDGYITLSELYTYTSNMVENLPGQYSTQTTCVTRSAVDPILFLVQK